MENLKKLCLLQSETNTLYEVNVTKEIYNRASMDMVFATKILTRRINEGITVFDGSVDSVDNTTEHEFSLDAGPSTAATSHTASSENIHRKRSVADDIVAKSAIHNWTKEEVLLLIATYKEHQLEFLEENASKTEVWSNVVKDMTTTLVDHGLRPIDEKKCRTKMDTLKRHYKNLKDSNKKSGNSKITWPYYDEMEELFGEQPWVQPLSTAGSNIPNEMEAEIERPPSKRQKNLKDYCDQLVEARERREKICEQHHREKIAAMNRLIDVVAQLVGNKNQD